MMIQTNYALILIFAAFALLAVMICPSLRAYHRRKAVEAEYKRNLSYTRYLVRNIEKSVRRMVGGE